MNTLSDLGLTPDDLRTDTPGRLPVTELANAERLVKKHGKDLRYCSDRGIWAAYNGTEWALDDMGEVQRMMADVVTDIYHEAANAPDPAKRAALATWAKQSESRKVQDNGIALARWFREIEIPKFSDVFDRDPFVLNCRSGLIELRSGLCLPHRREHYCTKTVELEYSDRADCPQFFAFLERTFPQPGMLGFVSRWVGYCLTGSVSEQSWAMIYGRTATGKSTFINILRALLGPYAFTLPADFFCISRSTTDFTTAHLAGVRLATAVESAEGRRLDESKLKNLTGGDRISAQFKYQGLFEFTPSHKLALATNHPPRITSQDDSVWRRLHVLAADVQVPESERDPDLAAKLIKAEGPEILRWAVLGAQAWIDGGLQVPDVVRSAVADYRSAEDTVGQFIDEECTLEPDERVSKSALYAKFREWAKENGAWEMSSKRFASEVQRFVQADPSDERRYWAGIRIGTL